MTLQGYLDELRRQLASLSSGEQAALLEEIGSHIESGEGDPGLGKDPAQRRARLMSELGSPAQMGRGFRRIYQPGNLTDYLLIAIPSLLNLPINLLLASLMPKYSWADTRLVIVFHLMLVGVGIWRRSTLLTIYWLSDLAVQLAFVLWYAKGYYGLPQMIVWYIVLAGLMSALSRTIWQNRHDLLVALFGLIPCLMGVFAITLRTIPVDRTYFPTYGWFPLPLLVGYADYLYYAILLVLALFFLGQSRDVRWGALASYWILSSFSGEWLDQYVRYPSLVYCLWVVLPVALILAIWRLDHLQRARVQLAA